VKRLPDISTSQPEAFISQQRQAATARTGDNLPGHHT
jgi:hypothetical protein